MSNRYNAPHDLVTCGRPGCLGPHFIRREDIDPGLDAALTAADQPTTEPSAVERVADLLIEHSRYRIEDCYCGWADLGKSHAAHVAQALADARLLAPAPQPAADTETEVQWGVRWRDDALIMPSKQHALDLIADLGGTLVSIREEA